MVKVNRNTIVILQARMSSSRLPGKVMLPINGEPMILRQIERIHKAISVNQIIVATSTDASDDSLAEYLLNRGVEVYRGSLKNVLSRYLEIEKTSEASAIIRLTGDCPLVMPELIDAMVREFYTLNVEYLSNTLRTTYPDGMDVEIVKPSALRKLARLKLNTAEKEHVTLGIYLRPSEFTIQNFTSKVDMSGMRWTVDYPEDLHFVRQVFEHFKGREASFGLEDVMDLLTKNPNLRSIVSPERRNEQLGGIYLGE